MKDLRIALAQINTTVGALSANAAKIALWAHEAADAGAELVVFPELALSGYPPEDLILKPHFIKDCETALQNLAKELPPQCVSIVGAPRVVDGKVQNTAVVFHENKIVGTYGKMLLPNYGVFDEKRVFAEGSRALVLTIGNARIALHICEDSWIPKGTACHALEGIQLDAVVNLSASPYHRGKVDERQNTLKKTATHLDSYMAYCNLIGGQDELVFDGASMALAPNGQLMARAKQFEEDLLIFDVDISDKKELRNTSSRVEFIAIEQPGTGKSRSTQSLEIQPMPTSPADVYSALMLGLHDYVEKNDFEKVVVKVSGGIDSALVATIAVDALGADRVKALTLPSQYTSDDTFDDANKLAKNLGIELHTISIKDLYEAYDKELEPLFKGTDPGIAEENIQARIRGNLVMALSNKFGWLVLSTGNKSEMAVGYCTLYGDMVGGLSVLKDVPKTLVYELAEWRNSVSETERIPQSTITRPPSAELRHDQKDTDSLPDYADLDPIIECYVEKDMGVDDIVRGGHDAATVARVIRMIDLSEYKRRQGAPGIKITPKAFGRDRRMPITNQYKYSPTGH